MLKIKTSAMAATVVWCALASGLRAADPPSDQPKPIPTSRPEIKRALEALKHREPRLPLPELTEAQREAYGTKWPVVNNGRARTIYLPQSWRAMTFVQDPEMTLDTVFKTQSFYIVCRGNNCQYCLGHQEHRLATMGLDDDKIASLDADWSAFTPAEQLSFALAKKMTLMPHRIGAEDVEALRQEFNDRQIVELVYFIGMGNSVNRWTDSLGLPQDHKLRDGTVEFDAPTSERFESYASLASPDLESRRPPLETSDEVAAALSEARQRKARVELLAIDSAYERLKITPGEPLPEWARALAYFPQLGETEMQRAKAMQSEGKLPGLLKAQICWICARQDRAWYALGHAQRRLAALGVDGDAAYALDAPGDSFSPAEREAFAFAVKLTTAPATIADADIARLRSHYADAEVAEIVYVIGQANMFDRFTETLGLQLED